MTRIVLVIFAAVWVVLAPQAMAQSLLSTTVKSSKSNTSDRKGQTGDNRPEPAGNDYQEQQVEHQRLVAAKRSGGRYGR